MRRPGLGLGFELEVNFNAGAGIDQSGGFGGSFSTSFSDINSGLFGTDTSISGTGTKKSQEDTSVTQTESLKIDRVGILKMIDDALRGTSGLAEIFGQQAGAGLFGSSAAKQGTEDLIAKIAGELAKVTGTKVATNVGSKTIDASSASSQTTESKGILDKLGF